MNTELLHLLIDNLDEFEKSNSSNKIEDFVVWLSGKYFQIREETGHQEQLDLMLVFQISALSKMIKKQNKEGISNSELSSLDGYSFLVHLEHTDSFRKMELIEMHNLEAPTGIEIIKRLLVKGLIEEFDDKADKRAKRVRMTITGRQELNRLKPIIDKKSKEFSKALSLKDKLNMAAIMKKLINA